MWTHTHTHTHVCVHPLPCHEQRGSESTPTFIPNIRTRCTLFLNFLCWAYYAQGNNLFYPLNGGWSGPLAVLDTFGRNSFPPVRYKNLHHAACRWSLLNILFQTPNSDGRTSKWIFTKQSLQLWTALNKLKTGYGCRLLALYKHSSRQAQWFGTFQVSTEN